MDAFELHPDLLSSGLPRRLILEVTSRCNLACTHCFQTYFNFPRGDMTPELFERLKPWMRRIGKVDLSSAGEPLLSPHFFAYLDWCLGEGLETGFTTNGSLLGRFAEALAGRNANICLSIDASTEAVYRKRRGADFGRLKENVERLRAASARKAGPFPLKRLIFAASRQNVRDLPGLVSLAHEWGVPSVVCFHQVFYWRSALQEDSLFHDQALYDAMLAEACLRARDLGIDLLHAGSFDGAIPPHPAAADYYQGTAADFDCRWILSNRSEERRVGKECRSRWSPYH